MPDVNNQSARSDGQAKALEAARDVVKQLVTIEAALLTFGVTYVSKTGDAWRWLIGLTVILLLAGILVGVIGLFQIVAETHSETGSINDGCVRGMLMASLAAFVAALCCLSLYVVKVPNPAASTTPSKPVPTSSPTPTQSR